MHEVFFHIYQPSEKRVKCFTSCEEEEKSAAENTHRLKSVSHAKHILHTHKK